MAFSQDLDLPTVIRELYEVRHKWIDIGIQLRLDYNKLKSTEEKYRGDPDKCFREMCSMLVSSSSQVTKTWSTLVDVLKQPCIGGFEELSTSIEQRYCQAQPQPGNKRPHPSEESEPARKRPHLEEGYICEELQKLLQANDQQCELISKLSNKIELLESSIKEKDTYIEELTRDNKAMRRGEANLKKHCSKLDKKLKEQSKQLQQLSAEIQKLQRGESKPQETPKQSECTPTLSPRQPDCIDFNFHWMRRALYELKDEWYDIGCELEVGLQFLDSIKKEHNEHPKECLSIVLREWLTQRANRNCTDCEWCELSEALTSPVLENDTRINRIVGTMAYHMHPECPPYLTSPF